MTQEDLAHTIGVTVSTVNRWENGHGVPSRLARKVMEGLVEQESLSTHGGKDLNGSHTHASIPAR